MVITDHPYIRWLDLKEYRPKASEFLRVLFTDGDDVYVGYVGKNGYGETAFYGSGAYGGFRDGDRNDIIFSCGKVHKKVLHPVTHWAPVDDRGNFDDVENETAD